MVKLKIMKVKIEDLKKGDFVLNGSESDTYTIIDKGITKIHDHHYNTLLFNNGSLIKKALVINMPKPNYRMVCRGV